MGPGKISGRILKECRSQLSFIFAFLFNQSLSHHIIPAVWKRSEIIPVPKTKLAQNLNDLRPVALTSVAFKCLERIVLGRLLQDSENQLDPMQFAYRKNKSVDDALLVFLNNITKHLDVPKSHARVLFIDFSSAFNTIQPHLLAQKLIALNVNTSTILWIIEFLTHRTQYVNLNGKSSETLITNSGAPQRCVLFPVLYSIYTNDYRTMDENICLIKFADDTTLHGLLSNSEEAYRSEVNRFCEWCKNNHLTLNVDKTKELVFDYRRKKEPLTPLLIDGKIVSIVDSYKYLGPKIDSKLNWSNHAHDVCKKVNQRLYFLRKLRSFKFNPEILLLFYRATIESIITYGINCWGSSIMTKDKERINRLIRKSEKIVKRTLSQIDCLYEDHAVKKAKTILKELTHPLNKQFLLSSRSGKIIQPIAKTERYRRSFVPSASALLRRLKSCDT